MSGEGTPVWVHTWAAWLERDMLCAHSHTWPTHTWAVDTQPLHMFMDTWLVRTGPVHIHTQTGGSCPWVEYSGLHTHTQHPHTRSAYTAASAAAASLQLCLTLCDPIDGSPPGSPVPGILQARTLEWVAISFSNA